jgi:WD40 repeat protein
MHAHTSRIVALGQLTHQPMRFPAPTVATRPPSPYNAAMSTSHSPVRRLGGRMLRFALALCTGLALVPALAGCGFHPGEDQIAFLRKGMLVTINPDGTGARTLAGGGIVSFAWSPDHHQMVFRTAVGSDVADLLPTGTIGAPDASGTLDVVSINGGRALEITPQANGIAWSDAWWDVQGNRLFYREELAGTDPDANAAAYIVSQADQPAGIARKMLVDAASLPASTPDGSRVIAISADGTLRLGPPSQVGEALTGGALLTLPGTGRPGRVLWQPKHDAVLYDTIQGGNTALVLRSIAGGQQVIATVPAVLDVAFSPDGSRLLLRTPDAFQLWPVSSPASSPRFSISESEAAALAWWSPDGRWLLIQNSAGWRLVNAATGAAQTLVQYGGGATGTAIPVQAQWHPAAGSPWSPDGTRFVFVATGGTSWLGKPLAQPVHGGLGLYVASIASGHPAPQPTRIDSGSDRVPSWSYADPDTTFLVAS